MGLSAGRLAEVFAVAFSGVNRRTSLVSGLRNSSKRDRRGRSITLRDPGNKRAIYSTTVLVWLRIPGCGPSGFAREPRPLPLAMSRCLPLGVTRTEVGYHPAGMKPSEWLLPGW